MRSCNAWIRCSAQYRRDIGLGKDVITIGILTAPSKNDRHEPLLLVGFKNARRSHTVHHRHHDVHEDKVETGLRAGSDRLGIICTFRNMKAKLV